MSISRCDDPVVMNYLIDAIRIETVLITDSKDTAESLTSQSENVPNNLSRILVPNLGLEFSPSPNYAVYSIRINPAKLIQVDVNDRVQQLKTEQNNLQQRSAVLQPQFFSAKQRLDHDVQQVKKKSEEINIHHNANTKAMQKIIDIENFEYREFPALNVLEAHLTNSAEKIEKFKEERETLQQQLSDLQERRKHAEEEANCENNILESINKKIVQIQEESQNVQNKLRDLDRHYEENQRRFKQTNELLQSMLKDKKELEASLEKLRQEAQKMGDFIETNKSEDSLREKISRCKAKMKHFEAMNLNSEEIAQKLTTLRDNLKMQTENFNQILSIVEKLQLAYHTRAQRFQRSRYHFFTMVQFQYKV